MVAFRPLKAMKDLKMSSKQITWLISALGISVDLEKLWPLESWYSTKVFEVGWVNERYGLARGEKQTEGEWWGKGINWNNLQTKCRSVLKTQLRKTTCVGT